LLALANSLMQFQGWRSENFFWAQWILSDVAAGLFSPVIFFCLKDSGLAPAPQRYPLKKIRTKAGEEPMLDAVMIAFLFLNALCVVIVLVDEIRASLSRLRARGR
jgi:hypothetical protein